MANHGNGGRNWQMSARARELNAYVTIDRTDKNETCVAHAALRRVGIAKDLGHRFMDGWITLPLRLLARTPGEEERKERRRLEEVLEWRRLRAAAAYTYWHRRRRRRHHRES